MNIYFRGLFMEMAHLCNKKALCIRYYFIVKLNSSFVLA